MKRIGRSNGSTVAAVLATACMAVAAQDNPNPFRVTLDQAVGHALSHNPDLVALRLGIDQARARANQAGRLASPELSSQVGPNIAGREIAVSVGFDQRFPALARLRAERAVSRAGLEEAAAEVDDAERRVVLRVRTSAVECLAASSQLKLKERQIANGRELVETARRAAERGEAARIEAEQWELETRQLELERLPLEASRREALAELRSWLGLPRERDLELIGQLPDPLLPAEAPWEPSIRPDYRAARARGEAAEHGIAVARAGRWDEIGVGLFGQWERREDLPVGLETERTVGLRVSVPLPLWGRFRGRIDEASATAARADREAEAVVVRARSEIEIARVRMDIAARRATEIADRLLPKALELERSLRDLHARGQTTMPDVLRARERRLNWEASAIAARRDFHLALASYEAATGRSAWARDDAGVPVANARPTTGSNAPRPRPRAPAPGPLRPAVVGTRSGMRRARSRPRESGSRAGHGFAWLACVVLAVASPFASAAEPRSAEPPVVLDASTIRNLRLSTEKVTARTFEQTVFALGRIRVAPGHQAFVSSRVPGRATRVDAHIDARVEKGTELVEVESRVAGDPPPTIALKAPMSGLIAAVNVALGQPVSPDASLIEIVALEEVHAVAAVPEHWVGLLKLGNRARLRVSALPDREFEAELAHFAAEADVSSGTLEAAFHVDNADYSLRPGMRAEFSIVVDARPGVLAISREAVQGDLGNRSVFVRHPEMTNAFSRVSVVLGAENDRYVEVLQGLREGQEVVARGAYSLAFAGRGATSLKAAMDAAHGHAHNDDGSEISKEAPETSGKAPGPSSAEAEDPSPAEAEDHDHDHDHDHDDADHDHDTDRASDRTERSRGVWGGRPEFWATFFAATTFLLLVLWILSGVARRHARSGAVAPSIPEGKDGSHA